MPESAWPNAKRRWAPEAIIGAVDERRTSVARAVLAFASTGLLVLILVGIAGVLVMRRLGTAEALRQAERIALVAGRGVVEPRLSEGIVRGDSSSLLTIDEVVSGSLLRGPIARVTIRDPDGRVLYADDPALIGSTVGLGASEQKAIRTGEAVTNEGTADELESRFEEDLGPLLEVSLPVSTPAGRPLLFQAYIPLDAVTASAEQLWRAFLPVLAVALIALAVVQIPLALRLARQVRASQQERELLLRRAIESSDLERRRIAGDLHDGPVQQLAGLSMSLEAAAGSVGATDPSAGPLREAASAMRGSVRLLRSALMGIYPANVQRAGLRTALADLAAALTEQGISADIDVPPTLDLPPEVESLLFRASREAFRNVERHAQADRVSLRVRAENGLALLEVQDDGIGFSSERSEPSRADGHIGLLLLSDLAVDAGGVLHVDSAEGQGTKVRLEVPIR
jgi:two-component system, NarL family, sensor kinase